MKVRPKPQVIPPGGKATPKVHATHGKKKEPARNSPPPKPRKGSVMGGGCY